jgi:hypothetical protein
LLLVSIGWIGLLKYCRLKVLIERFTVASYYQHLLPLS